MPEVSILIVTWNSRASVEKCLTSLFGRPCKRSFEVIAADNGSSDGTAEFISSTWPQARVLQTGRNLGFAPAMNLAQRQAEGRYLFWLNPDTVAGPGAVDKLADFLDLHPEVGAAGPLLFESEIQRAAFCARQFPNLTNAFLRHFGLRWLTGGKGFWGQETFEVGEVPVAVDCLSGAAMMVRRELADRIGSIDETIPMYLEDMDYCARIAAAERSIYCVPSARMFHEGGHSSAQSSFKAVLHAMEDGHAPMLFIRKFHSTSASNAFRSIVFLGNILRLVVGCFGFLVRGRTALLQRSANLVLWAITPSRVFEAKVAQQFCDAGSPAPDREMQERIA